MKAARLSFGCGLLAAGLVAAVCSIGPAAARAAACVGDCSGDGKVTVDELVCGVNIALGASPAGDCPGFDRGDGRVTVDDLVVGVNHALANCQLVPSATATRVVTATPTVTPTPSKTAKATPTQTLKPTPKIELELYDVGFLNIRKPKGWDVHIAGVCSTLGLLIQDPDEPLRQIFYFGMIGPVYLKEAQRQIDLAYIQGGGYNMITWLDAPAVDPLTAENFFTHWPGIADMDAAVAFMPQFPRLEGFSVVSGTPLAPMFPNGDSALLRGLFLNDGAVGEGQFLGSVWVNSPYWGIPGGGTAYGGILLGVTAPKREFKDIEAKLVSALESFTMTQGYIDWCLVQQAQLWGAVARQGQTLREASDIVFDGWVSRSQTSDIMAEKGSDAMLGLERVYDPSTNQTYSVPVGWFEDYDIHRGDYDMTDLQLLPGDSVELWTSVPADGGAIH